jgi:hypothetical protein
VGEADGDQGSDDDEGHDNSGLGDPPNWKKTHSAPELARSGHRGLEASRTHENGARDVVVHPMVRVVQGFIEPGQQSSTMTDETLKGQIQV